MKKSLRGDGANSVLMERAFVKEHSDAQERRDYECRNRLRFLERLADDFAEYDRDPGEDATKCGDAENGPYRLS